MLNELIREKRIEQNLSQNELASHLGYTSPQYISNVERNLCGFPAKKAKQLCKILKIKKGDFKEAYLKRYELKIDRALK